MDERDEVAFIDEDVLDSFLLDDVKNPASKHSLQSFQNAYISIDQNGLQRFRDDALTNDTQKSPRPPTTPAVFVRRDSAVSDLSDSLSRKSRTSDVWNHFHESGG